MSAPSGVYTGKQVMAGKSKSGKDKRARTYKCLCGCSPLTSNIYKVKRRNTTEEGFMRICTAVLALQPPDSKRHALHRFRELPDNNENFITIAKNHWGIECWRPNPYGTTWRLSLVDGRNGGDPLVAPGRTTDEQMQVRPLSVCGWVRARARVRGARVGVARVAEVAGRGG